MDYFNLDDLLRRVKDNDHDILLPLHTHISVRLRKENGHSESSLFYSNSHTANFIFPTGKYTPDDAQYDEDKRLGVRQFLERINKDIPLSAYFDAMTAVSIGAGIDMALAESFMLEFKDVSDDDLEIERLRMISALMTRKSLAWSLTRSNSEASVRNMGTFGCFLGPRYARPCRNLENFYANILETSVPVAEQTQDTLNLVMERGKQYKNDDCSFPTGHYLS